MFRVKGKHGLFLILSLAACGKSKLNQDFLSAAAMQQNLDQVTIPTWARSPTVDSNNYSLTAADNLCSIVPRGRVPLGAITGPYDALRASDLIIYKSAIQKTVRSFWDYLQDQDDCFSDNFQVPHTFGHIRKALDSLNLMYAGQSSFPNIKASSSAAPLTGYASEESADLRASWKSALAKKNAGNSSDYNSLLTLLGDSSDASASVFSTHYDTVKKTVRFYHDSESDLKNFNAGQEADAIYHETCHHFQNDIQPTYLRNAVSDASGALLEGLADFCAASILRDDNILSYFKANAPTLFGTQNTQGPEHQRSLRNSLKFPDNYVGEIHLDGRIVASALNDFRKYLAGEQITVMTSTCGTNCMRQISSPLSNAVAWDETLRLAYMALYNSSATDSLSRYAGILGEELLSGCATRYSKFCNVTTRGVLLEILRGRGLVPSTFGTELHVLATDIQVDTALSFIRYPSSGRSGYNDATVLARDASVAVTDKDVGRCEVLMVFPNIRNLTLSNGRNLSLVNGSLQLITADFTNTSIDANAYFPYPTNKVLPWLEPGEQSAPLILATPQVAQVSGGRVSWVGQTPSRVYADSFGSVFTQPFSESFSDSPVGWTVIMPPNLGDRVTLNFRLSVTPAQSSVAYEKSDVLPSSSTVYSRVITVNSSKLYPCPN